MGKWGNDFAFMFVDFFICQWSTESFDISPIFWFFVLKNNFLLYLLTMCVYGVCAHTQACIPMLGDACLSPRTCRSSFSPSTLWIPGIELRSLGFAASTFTCWLTLQALVPFTVSPQNVAGDEDTSPYVTCPYWAWVCDWDCCFSFCFCASHCPWHPCSCTCRRSDGEPC